MNDGNGNVRALTRRDALLKWTRRLGCLALCAILAFGSLRLYGDWRQQHLAQQVEQFAARGDYQNAVLVARRLLQLDENNLAACRAMAEMAEKAGRAEAITWRRKIAHLQPRDAASQLAFARSALGFGETLLAERILNSIPETARQTAEYQRLAGAAALAKQDRATAESHFAAALGLAPDDPTRRLISPSCASLLRRRKSSSRHAPRSPPSPSNPPPAWKRCVR
jgi:tetratricopeptide (TPR) repeat protein